MRDDRASFGAFDQNGYNKQSSSARGSGNRFNDTSSPNGAPEYEEDNEDLPLEYREEYKFKNGAIYKGQWKG